MWIGSSSFESKIGWYGVLKKSSLFLINLTWKSKTLSIKIPALTLLHYLQTNSNGFDLK